MEKFDIYIIKGIINNPSFQEMKDYDLEELWWNKSGFIGLNLDLKKAIKTKKELIKRKMVVAISPILYRESKKISRNEAEKIAKKELNKLKNINNKYGELINGIESPIWFAFLADDYELQKKGYIPGYWGCYIDKVSGEQVHKDIILKYEFL